MEFKPYEKSMLVYRGRKKNHNTNRYEYNHDNKTQNLKSIHRNFVQKSTNQPLSKQLNHNHQTLTHQKSSLISQQLQEKPSINRHQHSGSMHQLNPYNTEQQKYSSQKRNNRLSSEKKVRNQRARHNLSVESLLQTENSTKKSLPRHSEKSINQINKSVNFYINIEKLRNLKITSRQKLLITKKEEDQMLHRQFNPYLTKKNHHSLDKKSLILKNKNKSIYPSVENLENPLGGKFLVGRKNPQRKPNLRYKTNHNDLEDDDLITINNPVKSHASQYLGSKKSNFKKQQFKDKSFIEGYLKGKQLGRGGFSKVWQGFHFSTKQFYAIKQIDTTNKYQTHLTQIWFGNYFFQSGRVKSKFEKHQGVHKLLKMYQYSIIDPKAFIVYESCDGSLGNMLYDIYEEDVLEDEQMDDDEKMYMIKYKHLYGELRRNCNFLKHFIKSIAQALDLLTNNKIVHSDIKTENILLKKSQTEKKYEFKLIDYGSSFVFQSLKQYKLATPQYMCPQLLNYILFENKKQCHIEMLDYVKNYENISAIDVWGLGSIVIELVHGLPLWLNNPTKILVKGKYETKKGLFAVSDRSFTKILERQLSIVENFDQFLSKQNNSEICLDQQVKEVLRGMLNPNPKHRIRPHQIVKKLSQ